MIQLKNTLRLLCLSLCFVLLKVNAVRAQGFSYVYIQGDKKTPIYTKVEGVMMPRYGKNYALLSRLAPGPLNVEILFKQNEFPPLTFTILVPENGKRAFVLNHKGDEFTLYDVEQNFYLKPGNAESDDHLPTVLNNNTVYEPIPEPVVKKVEPTPVKKTGFLAKVKPKKQEPKAVVSKPPVKKIVVEEMPAPDTVAPRFIDDITFSNEQNRNAEVPVDTGKNAEIILSNKVNSEILNSDCGHAITANNFQKLVNMVNAQRGEDQRLSIINNATKQNCFSTEQARKLISRLDADVAKASALKNLFPKITDQANFAGLEVLLQSEEWKDYFRNLVQAK